METILEIENLAVSLDTPQGAVMALRQVSFALGEGETLAIVGESGCGKSVLCRAILGLLPKNGRYTGGRILAGGHEVTALKDRELERLRGRLFSMVLQDPLSSLDPTMPVGRQIEEAILVREPKLKRKELRRRAEEMLEKVGISQTEVRYEMYPHQFSGGLRQRCVLAMALAAQPQILLADEPTTALDATVQTQILDLLRLWQQKTGMSILLVSHDLGAVARIAHRVAVMYAGKIVEIGTAEEIFYDPRHPYTWALLRALPGRYQRGEELYSIPGQPPSLIGLPEGDAFAGRNEYALEIDYHRAPPLFRVSDTHYAATWLLDSRAPKVPSPVGGKSYG